MTKPQLESVIDALVEIVDDWNAAAADDDRGRSNDKICLTLYDDGSGFLGRRRDYEGPDGKRETHVDDWHEFGDIDGLAAVFREEGITLDPDSAAEESATLIGEENVRLRSELARTRALNECLAERVAAQAELLGKKAER